METINYVMNLIDLFKDMAEADMAFRKMSITLTNNDNIIVLFY